MKKVILFLLVLANLSVAGSAYFTSAEALRSRVDLATSSIGQTFVWPDDVLIADPELAYPAIVDSAAKNNVNVLRTSVGFDENGSPKTTHFALLTRPTVLYDSFELRSGRWPSAQETSTGRQFTSSRTTGDPVQVGLIEDPGGERLDFKPLREAYGTLPVAGRYVVESADGDHGMRFIEDLSSKLTEQTQSSRPLSPTDFLLEGEGMNGAGSMQEDGSEAGNILSAVSAFLVGIALLLALYFVAFSAKGVAVMSLNGLSTVRSWYRLIGGPMLLISLLTPSAAAIAVLVVAKPQTSGSRYLQKAVTWHSVGDMP